MAITLSKANAILTARGEEEVLRELKTTMTHAAQTLAEIPIKSVLSGFHAMIARQIEDLSTYRETLPEQEALEEQAIRKRRIPYTPNRFENGFAETSSCFTVQAVVACIQDAQSFCDLWKHPNDHAPYFYYEKGNDKMKNTALIEYMTGEKNEVFDDKTTSSLWRQVQHFTERDADIILAIFAHLIHPAPDGTAWFIASQFLDYRELTPRMQSDTPGGRKRRAGHRQEKIREVGESIGRLENIWLTLSQWIDEKSNSKKKRKRTQYTHKGRLLMIEEALTQRELSEWDEDGDPGLEIAWRIRPGSWLRIFLEDPNRQVATLCQKSLQYHLTKELWEKRLSRYFMFHGHINTRGSGGVFNREIGKLLQELSLEVNQRDPQRTRDRFEKAMNTLVKDRIIQEWHYTEEFSLPAKGWLATWLEQKISIYIAPTKGLVKG